MVRPHPGGTSTRTVRDQDSPRPDPAHTQIGPPFAQLFQHRLVPLRNPAHNLTVRPSLQQMPQTAAAVEDRPTVLDHGGQHPLRRAKTHPEMRLRDRRIRAVDAKANAMRHLRTDDPDLVLALAEDRLLSVKSRSCAGWLGVVPGADG